MRRLLQAYTQAHKAGGDTGKRIIEDAVAEIQVGWGHTVLDGCSCETEVNSYWGHWCLACSNCRAAAADVGMNNGVLMVCQAHVCALRACRPCLS